MRLVWCLFVAFTVSIAIAAQQPAPIDAKIPDILTRMRSRDLPTWEQAFDDMMGLVAREQHQGGGHTSATPLANFFVRHPAQAEPVKLGLIELLESANDIFVSVKDPETKSYTENDTEHYARLINAVASLEDERAIPALVGAMTTGGMARRGLLKYGDKALGPILEQLNNQDALVRSSALQLGVILLRRKGDPASLKSAADVVRSGLIDSSSVVRREAVQEVPCLENRQEFIPILEKISKTDPEKRPGKALDGGDEDGFYPVRYDARRALQDIQNNKTCAP
ncbi:MAG TPA: hypothetical protein VLX32_10585 [Candidatus Acidoferrum sp.]|nr:hypothetical protein [Candidatus Acidoferrum sp.]